MKKLILTILAGYFVVILILSLFLKSVPKKHEMPLQWVRFTNHFENVDVGDMSFHFSPNVYSCEYGLTIHDTSIFIFLKKEETKFVKMPYKFFRRKHY